MDVLGMDFEEVLTLSSEDLLSCCRELAILGNRVAAMQTVVTNRIRQESEDVPPEESLAVTSGARNTVDLVQRITAEPSSKIKARLKLGKQVGFSFSFLGEVLSPPLEHVARGLADGHLAIESADLIAETLTRCERAADPDDLEYAQRALVQAATGDDYATGDAPLAPLPTDKIRGLCRAWENGLDPDGSAPDDEERFRRRFFRMGPVRDGLVNARGVLLAETAAALGVIINTLDNPRAAPSSPAPSSALSSSLVGDSQDPEPDMRTPDQRRHDALALAFDVTLRSRDLPYLGGTHATIMVEVDAKSESKNPNIGWLWDHQGLPTPISGSSVRHLACGANIHALTTDSLGRIQSLGSPARTFNAHQRRALSVRDQGCVIPGCSAPPSWCEVHHVKPHAEGGPTHTDNGVLLCGFHHRTIDSGGWTITMKDGVPKVRAPKWLQRMYPQESDGPGQSSRRPGVSQQASTERNRQRQTAPGGPPPWKTEPGQGPSEQSQNTWGPQGPASQKSSPQEPVLRMPAPQKPVQPEQPIAGERFAGDRPSGADPPRP